MKIISVLCLVLALTACKKNTTEIISKAATVSDNALVPLKYHAVYFATNYPVVAGEVPPFTFTKTLYPDTRVKTLNMLSRAFPNHWSYPKQAYNLVGTFTYSTNAAKFVGTRETFQYSKAANGAAVRTSVGKRAMVYDFRFNNEGLCESVILNGLPALDLSYFGVNGGANMLSNMYFESPTEPYKNDIGLYYVNSDRNNDIYQIYALYDPRYRYNAEVDYTYNTSTSGNSRRLYQPTQYAISQEFSLLEVMQWTSTSKYERSGVTLNFSAADATTRVVQGQRYLRHKYDANGNLISYTYGDGVEQKIVWK